MKFVSAQESFGDVRTQINAANFSYRVSDYWLDHLCNPTLRIDDLLRVRSVGHHLPLALMQKRLSYVRPGTVAHHIYGPRCARWARHRANATVIVVRAQYDSPLLDRCWNLRRTLYQTLE
jgi:hypothetical protein